MTDYEFRQQLSRKLDAFGRLVNASLKAEDDKTARYALIQQAYEALGQFLENAMRPADAADQPDQGTGKSDASLDSSWSTIRPVPQVGLNLGSGTTKGEGSAWDTIQPVRNSNLVMDDQTVKSDDPDASAWSSIKPRRNMSGIEVGR